MNDEMIKQQMNQQQTWNDIKQTTRGEMFNGSNMAEETLGSISIRDNADWQALDAA